MKCSTCDRDLGPVVVLHCPLCAGQLAQLELRTGQLCIVEVNAAGRKPLVLYRFAVTTQSQLRGVLDETLIPQANAPANALQPTEGKVQLFTIRSKTEPVTTVSVGVLLGSALRGDEELRVETGPVES
jgi:hypothetical protein